MDQRRDPIADRHVEKIESLWDRAKTQTRDALEWGRKISVVGKLKLDVSRLQRERAQIFGDLGRRVHTLLKEGRFNPLELQELSDQIDRLNQKIEGSEREIEDAAKHGSKSQEGGNPRST